MMNKNTNNTNCCDKATIVTVFAYVMLSQGSEALAVYFLSRNKKLEVAISTKPYFKFKLILSKISKNDKIFLILLSFSLYICFFIVYLIK